MKKNKISSTVLVVALVAVITLFSCKKEETVRSLTDELASLNSELYSLIETQQPSAAKGKWGQIWATVAADAIGAYEGGKLGLKIGALIGGAHGGAIGAGIGGVIVGGGASYGAYVGTAPKSTSDPYPNGYISTLSSKYSNISIAGALHNTYLDLLFKSSGFIDKQTVFSHIFKDMTPPLDIDIYNSIFEELGINSEHSNKIRSLINNYAGNGFEIDILLSQYKENFGISNESEEIWKSFFTIFSSNTKISDGYFVIEKYIDFIQESGKVFLTDNAIRAFICAFSVALHSTNYWSILINE